MEKRNQDDIIKPIKDIFSINYNIPEYQRGYKWNEKNVKKLLEDIDEFEIDKNDDEKFYCLQNITIIKKEKDYYDLIDGQQRLTTLSILLAYLKKYNLLKNEQNEYRIKYSIREQSQKFLYKHIFEEQDNNKNYIEKNNSKYYYNDNFKNLITNAEYFDSQDVFHFLIAKYEINKFFEEKSEDGKEKFTKKLLDNVKIIVNEVVEKENYEHIFRNLNSNKVPLAEHDFIRAIFITRCKEDNYSEKISEKRIRIGYDLDNINIWWSKSSVNKYFKRFDKNNYKNISLLYNLFFQCFNYNKEKEYKSLFDYLDNNNEDANDILNEVLRFHNTMVDWYDDNEIYHLLGFLSTFKGQNNILNIWNIWEEENISRYEFKKKLKNLIKEELIKDFNKDIEKYLNEVKNSYYNWYRSKSNAIKLLILMDIIKILKSNERNFSRLPAKYFDKDNEDIEHIFSKTPNKDTTVKEAEENIENIKSLINEGKCIEDISKFKDKLIDYNETNKKLEELNLLKEYRELILSIPIINSIGNLVLLNESINRSYGNSEYEIKRNSIVSLHESGNKYIRNHTWTIFTKSFNKTENKDLNNWIINDIKDTVEYIRKSIEEFFKDN